MDTIGPSGSQLHITRGISDLSRSHARYIALLSTFDQYIIFRYTIGSGTINNYLIFGARDKVTSFHDPWLLDNQNAVIWTYQFFKYYNYPVNTAVGAVAAEFAPFVKYFGASAARFLSMSRKGGIQGVRAAAIVAAIIPLYIRRLHDIIMRAPRPMESVLVYKVSTRYPGVPESSEKPGGTSVKQAPFNSTTYDISLNFGIFSSDDSNCCLWRLIISPAVPCLLIPSIYHAFGFEREILLPPGVSFDISSAATVTLDYISKNEQRLMRVQTDPIYIGEVYALDAAACPTIKKRPMTVFDAVVRAS